MGFNDDIRLFKEKHLRNGFDNLGTSVKIYVHCGTSTGGRINNAAWVRSLNCIVYGDGDGINTFPLTSLDIVAHEFGHGIMEKTVDFLYEGESGSIDESLGDIWGACVENFCNAKIPGLNKSIWEVGSEVTSGTELYLRSMSNPHLKEQPKRVGDVFWEETNGCIPDTTNDFCHVHKNSGIMNYWFYLLVNGGSGVFSIGIEKAAKIVYRAETKYLSEFDEFDEARTSMIQAAIDLYQDNSPEVVNTTNAWYAVGVGEPFSCIDVTYLSYEDYYESIEIPGCNFDLTGVIVEPNAKLTLNAINDVLINGPFEVKLNAQFETK